MSTVIYKAGTENRRAVYTKYYKELQDTRADVLKWLTKARDLKVRLACGEKEFWDGGTQLKDTRKEYDFIRKSMVPHALGWYRNRRKLLRAAK